METEIPDKLSNLPDCILTEILKLLNAKEAFQTSILSTRWLKLLRTISHLSLHSTDFTGVSVNAFKVFLNKVYLGPMEKYRISDIDLTWHKEGGGSDFSPKLLEVLIKKAIRKGVHKMTIQACLQWRRLKVPDHSLTLRFLAINFSESTKVKLPNSIYMPLLHSLNISGLTLTPRVEKGYCEPFTDCGNLKSLAISSCHLQTAKGLLICNHKLSHLTIMDIMSDNPPSIIRLSTPSLIVTNIKGHLHLIIEH